MGSLGYLYIPDQCAEGNISCRLHIAFHGCLMGAETIGLDFVANSHLNEYAQANNLVILYPQVPFSKNQFR